MSLFFSFKKGFATAHFIQLVVMVLFLTPRAVGQFSKLQREAINYIDKNKQSFTALSDSIWHYAEPSFHEFKSAKLITDLLEREGFSIQKKVSGFPTVFVASYGAGKPVIGLYGEYDADSGASNKTVPYKEELVAGGYGHGGAHNLLGGGSLATALAIKDLIKKGNLKGTIRYYGSTAEGSLGTRAWLAKDGYFDDLDLSLYWHPAPVTAAGTHTWDALIDFNINIPRNEAERVLSVLSEMKKSADENTKLDYSTTSANIVNVKIQSAHQTDAIGAFNKIKNEVPRINDSAVLKVNRAHHQFVPNAAAMAAVYKNMELLGALTYTPEEINYTFQMQDFLKNKRDSVKDIHIPFSDQTSNKKMYGYSSDIGEASWFAPEIYFVVTCLPNGVNMHQWSGTAFTAHSIGHKGMIQAAKIMAITIIDYIQQPDLRDKIRKEFEKSSRVYRYQPLIE